MKVDKYKRDYHTATKNLKLAETQDSSGKLDGAVPQDQVRIKSFFLSKANEEFLFFDFSAQN